jgi:propanol-preferring alcohol dehydrogenase
MKASILIKPGPVEQNPLKYVDTKDPVVARDEVLVRVAACGVCRSNLHMIEGDWISKNIPSKLPIIPGHELVGVVEKLGPSVTKFQVGDRVGMQPLWSTCGTCWSCRNGKDQHCEKGLWTGENVDGGYAELITGNVRCTYKVPDEIGDEQGAPLFCAGFTAYCAVKKADPKGKLVAIFGIGGLGHLAIKFAKLMGARVAAVSRSPEHLQLAKKAGADFVLNSDHDDLVQELKPHHLADASVLFAPSNEMARLAPKVTKPGGIFVIATNVDYSPFPYTRELVTKGSLIGNATDMNEFLRYVVENKVTVETEKYPLSQANDALRKLKNSQVRGRAVLFP